MRGKTRIAAGLIIAGIVIFFCLNFIFSREPVYQGKPISYWFREHCLSSQWMSFDWERYKETGEALKAMGTNAAPFLVREAFKGNQRVSNRDTPALSFYRHLISILPKFLRPPQPVAGGIRSEVASFTLKEIRPPAELLLALVDKRLKSTDVEKHCTMLFLLGTVGDGAERVTPYLVNALGETNNHARRLAIQSLMWIGPPAKDAVPGLLKIVQAHDINSKRLGFPASMALGRIGSPFAAPARDAVKQMFEKQTTWDSKTCLAASLFSIDPAQTQALDFLLDGMNNHQPAKDRWMAVAQLGEIGPSAKAAVPALLKALEGTNDMLNSQIPKALTNLGVAPEVFLPIMKKHLNSKTELVRVNAATRVLDMNPADHEALLTLMQLIQMGSIHQDFAIDRLGGLGPSASEALPVLRNVANSSTGYRREKALTAIRRIEGKSE